MRVVKNIEELRRLKVTSVSIGNFDGVHLGHQAIIDRLIRLPHSLIVTFEPHPAEILSPKETSFRITSIEEKIAIFEELGVENLFILKFDTEIANMEAEKFIKWLVVDYIQPSEVIIGYNHSFGREAKGDFELLVHIGARFGFEVIRVPPVYVEGFPVSSTWIRRALLKGEVEIVNNLLGRPYSIVSQVISGEKRGTTLSYPTANLRTPEKKLIPKTGVYAVWVEWLSPLEWSSPLEYNQERFAGMMNVGEKPTFPKSSGFGIEVHIFDFNENLLNELVKVEFVKYLRETQAFKNSDALKTQLQKDEQLARELLLSCRHDFKSCKTPRVDWVP